MHFETRLWQFTAGVRLRILYAVLIGLVATCFGIARLALLGWLIGRVFAGDCSVRMFRISRTACGTGRFRSLCA